LSGLNSKSQAKFLADLAHELTTATRSFYDRGGGEALAATRLFNEIQHRLLAQLGYILTGTTKHRFSDAALVDVMFEWAEMQSGLILDRFTRALEYSAARFKTDLENTQ
jgi:hypothetical protein